MAELLKETPEEAAQIAAIQSETAAPEPPAAAPPPAPAPEPAKPAPPAVVAKPERSVPLAALREEREARQRLQRELEEIRKAKPEPTAPADIDENENPLGAIAQLKAKIRASEERETQQRQQQEFDQELERRVGERVTAYAADHPEYAEQVKFVREKRYDQLRRMKYSEEQILAAIIQEEKSIGYRSITEDLDPGELVAGLAEGYGWQAKAAEAPPVAIPVPAAPTMPRALTPAQDRVARLAKGHAAATSPSTAGGAAPSAGMTIEALLALDGAAFDAAFKKHGKELIS